MQELLRCPACHRWSDALLIWAAGDCCPSCNAEMGAAHQEHLITDGHSERVRPPAGLSGAPARRMRAHRWVSELR
ncbi:MAG: hypothetical protein ACTHM1_10630 [Solirubrobacteraceae bacterium]